MEDQPIIAPFFAQWNLDTIPACDEGMKLLRAFAERSPSLYERAAEVHFSDPAPYHHLKRNPLWQAFTSHWASCAKCNEV